jgi:outer membrane receptor protein involved in Fe transport
VNVATDLSGLRPAGIPEFSLSVGSTYTHEFSDTLKAIFHLDYNYESPVAILDGLPQIKREVQGLNGAVSLDIGKGLELTVWGRNIANSQYLTTIFPSVAQLGSLSGYPSQPRTYGGAIRYRF